jgi:flagellar export protein FliJ
MADPLATLLRLRRLALDQARRDLADCLLQEGAAMDRVHALAVEIARETATAGRMDGDDQTVEDFARWLRRIRVEQQTAADALLTAETRTREIRVMLTAGRSAVEMVEALIAQRDAAAAAAAQRREQAVLDEAGQRPAAASTDRPRDRRTGTGGD